MNERVKRTLNYVRDHNTLAPVRDVFFLLGGKQYDETLYRLIALLEAYQVEGDYIQALLNTNNQDGFNAILKRKYIEALNDPSRSIKQIKKLRHAYYEFAIANDVDLNALISGGAHLFELKKEKHRGKRFGKVRPMIFYHNNKWISKIKGTGAEETQELSHTQLDDPKNYIKDLQNSAVKIAQEKKFSLNQLKELRYYFQQACGDLKITPDLQPINDLIKDKLQEEHVYAIAYSKIQKTLIGIKENPTKTGLRYKLASPLWDQEMDSHVFFIMNHIANMGLYSELMGIINTFLTTLNVRTRDPVSLYREQLQKFLDMLYALFNSLSIRDDVSEKDLKELKKLIHAFAEHYNFEKKLFNLRKTYKKHLADKEISEKLKFSPNRKYAYIDNLTNEITQKKIRLRNRKKWLNRVSIAVSLSIALGEGLVAAMFFFAGGWIALIPSLLVIGIAGFAVNYFLFRLDSIDTLKQFFVSGIFKDEKGNEISLAKKIGISMTLLSTIAAAAVFGVFAYSSVFGAVTALLAAASIAFPPLAIAIAGLLAMVTLIAFTCVFYCILADFIKNDRIKQLGNYFKNNYYDVWFEPVKGNKVAHYLGVTAKVIFKGLILLGTLALCGLITAITLGLGHTQAVGFLKQIPMLSTKAIEIISMAGIYVISLPVNSFFYWKSIIKTMNRLQNAMLSIAEKIISPNKIKSIKEGWKAFNENKLRRLNLISAGILNLFLTGCAFLNGVGQGMGPYKDTESIVNVEKMTGVASGSTAAATAASVAGMGSFSLNSVASINANALPNSVAIPEDANMPHVPQPEIPQSEKKRHTSLTFFKNLREEKLVNTKAHPENRKDEIHEEARAKVEADQSESKDFREAVLKTYLVL